MKNGFQQSFETVNNGFKENPADLGGIFGMVFNIQRFSVHDGPGIRTNLFLSGCPLHCAWCHNPEGQHKEPVLSFLAEKCIYCGACVSACPNGVHTVNGTTHILDRTKCVSCGKCTSVCSSSALEIMGKAYSVSEAVREAMADEPFYRDGGGVTLTGGEPFSQIWFASAIAEEIHRRGISVCMETSGYTTKENIAAIAPFIDIFLFDIKETDPDNHKKYTGVSLTAILENLAYLDEIGTKIILRCPIIPHVNDRMEHFEKIAGIASSLKGLLAIELEPYHPLGIGKSIAIGTECSYREKNFLEKEECNEFLVYLSSHVSVPVRFA